MSDRRKQANARTKTYAYIGAGLVHLAIIAAIVFNYNSKPKSIDGAYAEKVDVVKATTVDESEIKKRQDKLKRDERDKKRKKEREEKRLRDLKAQSEKEKDRIKKLKQQQDLEKKKAIALKKKNDKDEAERLAKEKEEFRRLEKERIAREEEEFETQRLLNESLAAEEAFLADKHARERTTTLIAKYGALIEAKVFDYRTISPDFERWRVATVNIKLSPLGDVLDTSIVKSSGSQPYDRSVESAVLKASPLPIPDLTLDADAHNTYRDFNIKFPMP